MPNHSSRQSQVAIVTGGDAATFAPPIAGSHAASADPLALEVVTKRADAPRQPASLLFVHGINVGAWVWEDHFLSYFAAAGFDAHALSFRGHGGSGGMSASGNGA